jgi:hypothetical protein
MGYRSSVVIGFSKKEYDLFCKYIDENFTIENFKFKNSLGSISKEEQDKLHMIRLLEAASVYEFKNRYSKNEYVAMYWDYVKWYEEYPEVKAIVNYLNSISDTSGDPEVCFIRVGEDFGDCDKFGNGDVLGELDNFGIFINWGLQTPTAETAENKFRSIYKELNSQEV